MGAAQAAPPLLSLHLPEGALVGSPQRCVEELWEEVPQLRGMSQGGRHNWLKAQTSVPCSFSMGHGKAKPGQDQAGLVGGIRERDRFQVISSVLPVGGRGAGQRGLQIHKQ